MRCIYTEFIQPIERECNNSYSRHNTNYSHRMVRSVTSIFFNFLTSILPSRHPIFYSSLSSSFHIHKSAPRLLLYHCSIRSIINFIYTTGCKVFFFFVNNLVSIEIMSVELYWSIGYYT